MFSKVKCSVRGVTTLANTVEDIPTPKKLPIVGTMLSLLAAGSAPKLHKYADLRHKQLGPIFKDKIGPVSAVFVASPEAIRTVFSQEGKYPMHVVPEAWHVYNRTYKNSRGLFFMDGEEWLHYRKIMNKLLLKTNTEWIETSCKHVADDLVKRWEDIAAKNEIFPNLENKLYRWSIDVLMSILIGPERFSSNRNKFDATLQHLANVNQSVFENTSKLSLISSELARKLNIPAWKKFSHSVTESLTCAKNLVSDILEERNYDEGLLSQMLEKGLTKNEIVRIVSDLVLAAGDTTAYSMEWILYCVAKNENVQKRIRKEAKDVQAQVLRNVVKECLRLYPVAPFLTRILSNDVELLGYTIPANTLIILSIYTSGRSEVFFKNPNEFNPDRWVRSEENNISLMQYCTLPFAMGTRSCIGKKIAETQLKVTLLRLVENFTITLKNTNEIEFLLKMVAVPSEPIKLSFKKIIR